MPEFDTTFRSTESGWRVQHVEKKNIPIWEFDLLGDEQIVFQLDREVSAWKRFWTRFFMGSSWRRAK